MLPSLLREIAKATDEETALIVAKLKGGQRAYFARKPKADNWLVKAVGMEKAAAIGQTLGSNIGLAILVPKGPQIYNERRAKIEAMILDGDTITEICSAVGVHERTVGLHRKRLRDQGLLRGYDRK